MTPQHTAPHVLSIGYEGRTHDDFVALLATDRIEVVVDVRMTPQSRIRGFSKRGLAEDLQAHGIGYVHMKALGNPKDNRDALRHGRPEAAQRYLEHVRSDPVAAAALDTLAAEIRSHRVAVMCLERDHIHCHRSLVLDELRTRGDRFDIDYDE